MNFLAIGLAALSAFLLGGIWYAEFAFGRAWNRLSGASPKAGGGHPARVFGLAFLFALAAAFAFDQLFASGAGLGAGLRLGALLGGGVAAMSFGVNYQFANRGLGLTAIDGGYHLAQFLLYGVIFGILD